MKNLVFTAVLAVAGTCAAWAQDPSENEEVRQYIDERNEQVEQWLAEGLIDSVVTVFAVDVVQIPPHSEPVVGIDAFRENWKQGFDAGTWDFDFKVEEVKVSGDLAVERGSYTLDFAPKPNAPMPAFKDQGNYVAVWERKDGQWKIVWDAPVSSKSWEDVAVELKQMEEFHKNSAVKKE